MTDEIMPVPPLPEAVREAALAGKLIPVRLEIPILLLNPGLRQRCTPPDV
jgi:hypothetical protein